MDVDLCFRFGLSPLTTTEIKEISELFHKKMSFLVRFQALQHLGKKVVHKKCSGGDIFKISDKKYSCTIFR